MKKNNLFFIDAETDGLYGTILTVGIYVMSEQGHELERAYWGLKSENMKVSNQWVKENVLPILGEYEECEDENELLEKVWQCWERHREDAYAVADVQYPVECRVFEKCVQKDPENRMWKAPFPILDVSSVLWTKGIDPLKERTRLLDNVQRKQHNAFDDVMISAELIKKLMRG